jgi:hypothetical protein
MGFGGGMRGFGGVHGGMHSFGGFHGAAFAPRFAARPMMFRQAAFAPHFANRPFVHRAAFVNRPFFHRRRHFGAAFAAGLIGATAVGLASSAYAYPYDGYGYYPASYGYGDGCYVVRRRHVNPWGYVVVRRQLICD